MADDIVSQLPAVFTAAHVRTWAASPRSVSRARMAAFRRRGGLELYCAKLDEVPAGESIFMASDSPDAVRGCATGTAGTVS